MSREQHRRTGLSGLSRAASLSGHTQGTGVSNRTQECRCPHTSHGKGRHASGSALDLDSRFFQCSLKKLFPDQQFAPVDTPSPPHLPARTVSTMPPLVFHVTCSPLPGLKGGALGPAPGIAG